MIKYTQQPTLRAVAPLSKMLLADVLSVELPNADKLNFGEFIILHGGDVFCVLGDITFGGVSFYAVLTQHSGVGYIVEGAVVSLSDIIV